MTDDSPSVKEIAELLRELRRLTEQGPGVDPDEREAFLARKKDLLERIERAKSG